MRLAGVVGCLGVASAAAAQPCPRWLTDVSRPGVWHGPNHSGIALAAVPYESPAGSVLAVGGQFQAAGLIAAHNVALWDGARWSALGLGVDGTNAQVRALVEFDDGTGPALYAGGIFTSAGTTPALNIARWDGTGWSSPGQPGAGLADTVHALAVYDDGTGPALYVGGQPNLLAPTPDGALVRWDGNSWSRVGGGLDDWVESLCVFDDGAGPSLFVGGRFSRAGAVSAFAIARWDGSSFHAIEGGISPSFQPSVQAMAAFDDGTGPALYVGGRFGTTFGGGANHFLRWDGRDWEYIGGPNASVDALAVFDDGGGPGLYAGGQFTTLARWRNGAWLNVGGLNFGGGTVRIEALAALPEGLFLGGMFNQVGCHRDLGNVVAWGCPDGCYADCDGDGILDFFDFLCFQNAFLAGCP